MRKHHVVERRQDDAEVAGSEPLDPDQLDQEEDRRSLDLVQRVVGSVLVVVVGGAISFLLAGYTALSPSSADRTSLLGLWVMSGVTGLLTTAAVLVINRRHPYSPLLACGLLPMAIAAYWVLT